MAMSHLIKKSLSRHGFEVDIARDGKEGISMYKTGVYDLILLDHAMPVYNGLEVIKLLSSEGDLPPIIMVTGNNDEKIAVMAIKKGAYDYIIKDTECGFLELLPAVIEQAINKNRLIKETQQ